MRKFENLKIALCCLTTLFLFSNCKREVARSSLQKNTVSTDTISKQPDEKEICNTDFDLFFEKFAADSVYQMKHIKFPLKDSYPSDDFSKMTTDYVVLKDCQYFDFRKDREAYKKETDAYAVKVIKKQDSVSYNWRGVDNGVYIDFKFALINGCWYMIEIDDHST